MPGYYYIELLFDPDEARFADVVEGVVGTLLHSGCTFREITVPKGATPLATSMGEFSTAGLENLREMCEQVTSEGLINKRRIITFPPGWGRVMFTFDFESDAELRDEIWDEEDETGSHFSDLGLSFTFSPMAKAGRYTKMTLSFWEEFVLKGGQKKTHAGNMKKLVNIFESIAISLHPYFGAMNNELHMNPDRSLEKLNKSEIPDGNEYVYVGRALKAKLGIKDLMRLNKHFRAMPDGSVLIEFTDRWGSLSPLL